MKRFLKITGIILGVILLLGCGAMMALQLSPVQKKITDLALKKMGGVFDGDISVGSISLLPFNTLIVKDVLIRDVNPYEFESDPQAVPVDTFAYVGYAAVKLSLKSLFGNEGVQMRRAIVRHSVFNLVIEPNHNDSIPWKSVTNLERIFRMTKGKKKEDKPEPGKIFEIENVEVTNFIFRLIDYHQQEQMILSGKEDAYEGGINWSDLELITDIKGRRLGMEGFKIHGTADHVEIFEKSGAFIDHVSGSVVAGGGETLFSNLHIRDAWSDINVPDMKFLYGDQKHFNRFVRGVRIVAEIDPSTVDLGRTIGYFAPALLGNPNVIELTSGGVDGPVCDMGFKKMVFREKTSGVSAILDGKITGLPKSREMVMDFDLKDFNCTTASLTRFIRNWAPGAKVELGKYAPREQFSIDAKGHGTLDHLAVNGTVRSTAGNVRLQNVLIENLLNSRPIAIGGGVAADALDLGRIIGTDKVGRLTMNSSLQAELGKKPLVVIDSLSIRKLHALGYDYSNIRAQGVYSDDAFDGRIVSHDPNLDLMAQGLFNVSGKSGNSAYEFYVNLGYADLGALGLDKKGKLKLALNSDVNFIRTAAGDMLGDVALRDVILSNDNGNFDIGDLTVQSHFNDQVNRMKFNSKFFDGTYVSTEPITSFIRQLTNRTIREELPALFTEPAEKDYPADYELSFVFHETGKLLAFVLPSAYIENNSRLDVNLTKEGKLDASLKSGRIAVGDKYLKDIVLDIDNSNSSINATLSSSELSLGGIKLLGANAILYGDDNLIGADIRYDNKTARENKGDISLAAELRRDRENALEMAVHVLPSSILYDGDLWRLSSDEILVKGKDISIDRFQGISTYQSVLVDGGISPTRTDTLSVRMEEFDISLLDNVVGGGFNFKGHATGSAFVTSPTQPQPSLLASLQCDSTEVAGYPLGRLEIDSRWNEPERRFDLSVLNHLDGRNNIDAQGWITGKGDLDVAADLDQFNLGYIAPILTGVFSTFDGGLSGKVRARGTLKKPAISSEDASLQDAHLTLDYTKVPYTVNGPVSLSERAIEFNGVDITDGINGTGKVTGGVYFNTLKDISLGVNLNVRNMKVLNTREGDDPSFYGDLTADGTVDVSGPVSDIAVDINARTSAPGSIHIPLGNASGEKRDFLTFYQPEIETEEDPYELMMRRKKETGSSKSDLGINIHVTATPEVTAYIEVDKATGNILSANGNGTMDIVYTSRNNYFGINGNYLISSGKYLFNALEIINKEFTVKDGSSVRFNGDIMETDLNIDGLYTTTASLSKLLNETEGVETRRTVECGFNITDKLRNPQINLSINVPDLDPTTQAQVESALNTEDKVQKQFIYLLIAGSFLPTDVSGIVNNSADLLYSNVSSIMSNQINNIFQKLDIPLDLGLNYKSTEAGNNLFDVAVSTALFQNRVIVNGAIGNREYTTTGKTSVFGDLDIEVKLDRQGHVRLSLFSHSADKYSNFLDNSQRNGGGITYQREFNSFRQFFRTLFTSRKKRQEEYIPDMRQIEKEVIEIDEKGRAKNDKKKKK